MIGAGCDPKLESVNPDYLGCLYKSTLLTISSCGCY